MKKIILIALLIVTAIIVAGCWQAQNYINNNGNEVNNINNTNATHRICSGNNCITVQGSGYNQCDSNANCGNQTQNITHRICSGNNCIAIQGNGTNQCNTSAQCRINNSNTSSTI